MGGRYLHLIHGSDSRRMGGYHRGWYCTTRNGKRTPVKLIPQRDDAGPVPNTFRVQMSKLSMPWDDPILKIAKRGSEIIGASLRSPKADCPFRALFRCSRQESQPSTTESSPAPAAVTAFAQLDDDDESDNESVDSESSEVLDGRIHE